MDKNRSLGLSATALAMMTLTTLDPGAPVVTKLNRQFFADNGIVITRPDQGFYARKNGHRSARLYKTAAKNLARLNRACPSGA